MKTTLKSLFCFIICAFLLAGCSFIPGGNEVKIDLSGINSAVDAIKPKDVTGEMNYEEIFPSDGIPARELELKNISFTNTEEAKIIIIPSDETKVEASYPMGMHEHNFRISVREGEIEISAPKQTNFKAEKFEITVHANIEEIEISGGIAVEMDAANSRKIDVDVKGGAEIYIYNIAAERMEMDIAGAASVDLSGKTDILEMELNGAGTIDAKSLICRKANIEISGAGTAEISVIEKLFADIDGVGSLKYYGSPEVQNISGGLTDIEQASKDVYGG